MCLAIPVRIVSITESDRGQVGRIGSVDVHGSRTNVSLGLVPSAVVGDWVLVHAGMAIEIVDEAEARETWRWMAEAGIVEALPEATAP